jgi:hypothetical protein
MAFGDVLRSTQLFDCHGRVTHRLVLQPDGRVTILIGAVEVLIEPTTRLVTPPGVTLGAGEYSHDQVVGLACDLAAGR